MRRLLRLALITGLMIVASACDLRKPGYMSLDPPDGPPEYRQGWYDGCISAMDANANHFYKTFLTVRQDEELTKNPVYYQVWKDAYLYCRYYQEGTNSHGWGNFK